MTFYVLEITANAAVRRIGSAARHRRTLEN